MESLEQIVSRVMAEYDQHLAEWRAVHPNPAPRSAEPFRPGRMVSIERERGDVVYRSQCPYVGVTRLIKGAR